MRKWIGLTSLAVLSGCSNLGDGEVTTKDFPVEEYHTLVVTSNIDTYITASPSQTNQVSVTIDANLAGQVDQTFEEGVLTLSSEQKIEPTAATMHVTASSLDTVTLDKTTQAWIAVHQYDDFELNVVGSSDIQVSKVELEEFFIDVAGQANINAMGMVKTLDITVSGSGDFDLSGLNSHNAKINISGNADVVLGTVNNLDVTISGNGNVQYKTGARAMVQSNISGSGNVTSYK
jgi:hypothetical protein